MTLDRSTIEWGIRLGQNANRDFTDKDGRSSWRLAGGLSSPARFRMNVNRSNLTAEGDSGRFTVRFLNNSTNTTVEEVYVTQTSGSQIRVENSSGTFCDVAGPRTVIDFVDHSTQNTTTGERTPCSALRFLGNIEGTYDVRFANAENVSESTSSRWTRGRTSYTFQTTTTRTATHTRRGRSVRRRST